MELIGQYYIRSSKKGKIQNFKISKFEIFPFQNRKGKRKKGKRDDVVMEYEKPKKTDYNQVDELNYISNDDVQIIF